MSESLTNHRFLSWIIVFWVESFQVNWLIWYFLWIRHQNIRWTFHSRLFPIIFNYFKVAVKVAARLLRLVFCICCVWNRSLGGLARGVRLKKWNYLHKSIWEKNTPPFFAKHCQKMFFLSPPCFKTTNCTICLCGQCLIAIHCWPSKSPSHV